MDPIRQSDCGQRGLIRRARLIAATTVLFLAAAGCSGSGGKPSAARSDPKSEGTKFAFDPANFVDPTLSTNPFHPSYPGPWRDFRAGPRSRFTVIK